MKVYLAAPSREMPRAHAAAAALVEAGHVLTSQWHEENVPPSDAVISAKRAATAWSMNRDGILKAGAVVALACENGGLSQGVREEIAYAQGVRDTTPQWREVVLVGEPWPSLAVAGCTVVPDLHAALVLLGRLCR